MPASFRLPRLKGRLRRLSLLASCLLLAGFGAAAGRPLAPAASAQANLLTNGDFAAGTRIRLDLLIR